MNGALILAAAMALQSGAHGGASHPVVVVDAHVRPIPASLSMTAGYLTLRNTGARPERLISVKCACAAQVSLHQTMDMNGMSSMRASQTVVVPPHASVLFTPGGRHLMLMGVKGGIKPGRTVRMRLTFDHAGTMTVPFVARN